MKKGYNITIFIFSLIGVLFSGWLTLTKLISGSCPLTEGCPYFFGYPACMYGFILFIVLLVSSIVLLANKKSKGAMKVVFWTSLAGILFSAYSTYVELFQSHCPAGGCVYSLLIPTCIYGLVMYIVIFIMSWLSLGKK